MILSLPWPPSQLSPNSRSHWATKAKVAKSYRMACVLICRATKLAHYVYDERAKPVLVIIFHPPSARRMDLDNMLASFKHGIDGIAAVLGVDDHEFALVISKGDPVKNGQVEVTLS